MTEKEIDRITELSRKSRTPEGLTSEEKAEQATLRRAYIDSVVGNLRGQLNNAYVQNADGSVTPLKKDKK